MTQEFFAAAEAYLKEMYGIEPIDIDLTPEQDAEGDDPIDFIERYADRFDLIKRTAWTPARAQQFLNRFNFEIA